ncbi:hypothetical protein P154DRAFT_622339 [Amniculicola lignicola CBS 123094]|uniref:Heterokaryon incompatibility domain-containing protein n=1 Tax=Amniculicola lignicola CBS 123094 TaxID=1392246 RepID=A0A6A5W785_9PLEO|nr:hypothetical protein P154DRAFT_622339 [Amniculicola lignicola CBS 123094]
MASVYSNAYVTIGATASSHSSQGIFRSRTGPAESKFEVSVPVPNMTHVDACYETEQRTVRFIQCSTLNHLYQLPLFERGWTLQETLLSRRMIHFTPSEIVWHCFRRVSMESDLGPSTRYNFNLPMDISSPEGIAHSWSKWIENYSRRRLTVQSDKMAALTGLVKFTQAINNDDPLFGLWKRDLMPGLLWERNYKVRGQPRIEGFPTWSWMSMQTPINYHSNFRKYEKCECELIESRVTWCGEPYSSAVLIADLLLKAKILEGTITSGKGWDFNLHTYCEGETVAYGVYGSFDIEISLGEIYCILICASPDNARGRYNHLLVCSLVDSELNVYSRLGYGRIQVKEQSPDPFKNVELQNFILR